MNARIRTLPLLTFVLCAGLVASLALPALAEDGEKPPVVGKNSKIQLSGVGWAVYRYKLADEPTKKAPNALLDNIPSSQVSSRDYSSFDLDRVYLTVDYMMNDRWSWQTQLEAQNLGGATGLWVKKAYVKLRNPFGVEGTALRFGQIDHVFTPVLERAWGYRSVSKVSIDRYLGVSTTWLGVGGNGKVLEDMVDFDIVIANQSAYNAPLPASSAVNKYKTFMGSLTFAPLPKDEQLKGLMLSVFGQYTNTMPPSGPPKAGDNYNFWYGVFPHYTNDKWTAGAEFDDQKVTSKAIGIHRRVISGFAAYSATDKVRLFGRVDQFDPNTADNAKGDQVLSVMAGLSHNYTKSVRSIFDVEYSKFQEPDPKPAGFESYDPDVTLSARVEVTL